ncbi:hypothetical protein BOO92_21310 [Vibrio navarrensis]|nr:hypothetical protein [Vibrio navarrensis]
MAMERIDPDKVKRPVFVLQEHYEATDGPWHSHKRAQFIHAGEGVLTVRTATGLWVVPPLRGVWIIPGEAHKIWASKKFLLRTLYVEPSIAPVPPSCCVMSVDHLLEALFVEASTFDFSTPLEVSEQRLVQVILDRLSRLEVINSYLPTPTDTRMLRLTAMLEQDLADSRSLEELAGACGMTSRTAARLFIKETGLTFGKWRQQLRLLRAMQSLSLGGSVTSVAAEVGYSDISAFINVFKHAFGKTPAKYFQ